MAREERPVLSDKQKEGQSTEISPPVTGGETKQALGMLTKCSRDSSSHVQILTYFLVIKADSRSERPHLTTGLIFLTFSKMAVENMSSWLPTCRVPTCLD